MDYPEKLAYINQNLLTKDDVLESLEKYREYCEGSQGEGWSENKRKIMMKLLNKFWHCLNHMCFPDIQSSDWFYQYSWKPDGIVLILGHCDGVECDEEGKMTSMESSDHIVLAEVKCDYLTVEEYAEKYDVTVTAVRQWIRRGKLRSAVKAGRDWLIPELADRPKRGYEPVFFSWEYLPENLKTEFPFLKKCFELVMMQNDENKGMFDLILRNKQGKVYDKRQMNTKEREKLELALISEPSVQANELRQDIMFEPAKERRAYLYQGEIMTEDKYEMYQKALRTLKENNLEISTSNWFYDEDGMLIWGFSAELLRWDDGEEENGESRQDKIAVLKHGIVIPAETDFMDKDCEYHSAAELCDSISADMISAYLAVSNENEGIKEEILKELDLPEEAAFESSILYMEDMEAEQLRDLTVFLKFFDFVVEGIPAKNCRLAICLMNWERESQKVKSFLECGWKIRSIDQDAVLAYRRIR